MRRWQSLKRHAGWLTGLAAALSLALGAGTAAASTPDAHAASRGVAIPAVTASGVTWHKLGTTGGWHGPPGHLGEGDPSWAVAGGVVYLTGTLIRSRGGAAAPFAVLPERARPSHTLFISVLTYHGAAGTLVIHPNGRAFADGANAPRFTSLDGLSYPAGSTSLQNLTLIGGWNSSQGSHKTGDPSYTVQGGVVYLSGGLNLAGSSREFAVLPKAARPAHVEYIAVYTDGGRPGTLLIRPSGIAQAYGGSAKRLTSLAGVSYPVATAVKHRLKLLNGWHSVHGARNSGDPSYSVRGGVVHLSGSLGGSRNSFFAALPASVRPRHKLFIKLYSAGGKVGTLQINRSGAMFIGLAPVSKAEVAFTSLAAISFPLGS
jgi:hypothetical protein